MAGTAIGSLNTADSRGGDLSAFTARTMLSLSRGITREMDLNRFF